MLNYGYRSGLDISNVSLKPGFYYGSFINAPTSNGHLIVLGAGSSWYAAQILISDAYPVGKPYFRDYNSGAWSDWRTI